MTSVYIVGNCHQYGMRRSIQFFDSALRVEACNVADLRGQFRDADHAMRVLSRFDHVLTIDFDGQFLSGLTSAAIVDQIPQTVIYPTVTFGAFHPDVVFVSYGDDSGNFLPSPLGPYHSALALYGYRRGYDANRTIGLFRAETYQALGYLSVWDVSIDELSRPLEAKRFGLRHMALGWLRQGCFMHNPQHPKVAAVCDIARTTMSFIGIMPKHGDPAPFIPDDLLVSHIWPVYPEIADFYGLTGSYTFKRQIGMARWPEFMTLEEFVLASYECYRRDLSGYRCERVDGWLAAGLDL